MCLLRLKNQFSNVTSFKQVHGRTGSTALSGPSQTLSLASSSGTPCSAGAQALCPRRPAATAKPSPLTCTAAPPSHWAVPASAHQSWPGPLSRDPTLPPRSLPSKDTRWALSLAGHTPLKKPVLQILQAPCSCTTTARGPQDMWPPQLSVDHAPCVTSSPSARPVCSPGDRHSPPCPSPGPLSPLTGSEAPSLVTTATSLLVSILLQMSFAKKSPSHAGWGVTAKAGGHPTLLAAPLCPQQLTTPRSPHTSQPGPDLRTQPHDAQRGDRNRARPACPPLLPQPARWELSPLTIVTSTPSPLSDF